MSCGAVYAVCALSTTTLSFVLPAAEFFSGFGIIGATGLVFPYFGDFLSLRHRDVMLCRLEVFWTFGTILLPGIAWLIIQDPRFNITSPGAGFQYTSWRVFVASCGIPSLLVVLLLVESMISVGDGEEEEVVAADNNGNETKTPLTWKQRWQSFWKRKKMLVTPPYIGLLVLCCFVDFGLIYDADQLGSGSAGSEPGALVAGEPAALVATAMAVTVTCGRVGAIVGNVIFGALVDQHCIVPIYMFGALLITSGLLCTILPKSTRPERPQ
ncbi:unnamed protein product [Leptidea sinapis]|uniref:Major facilitator superfamily (MFS) profile domain-containing protein n=1 Tax=Leptidea sinapis TaxID=189913 RepID=A0A5E4QS31_9NEOP|nr:unnamed protein product [Leptidea sinapis]